MGGLHEVQHALQNHWDVLYALEHNDHGHIGSSFHLHVLRIKLNLV